MHLRTQAYTFYTSRFRPISMSRLNGCPSHLCFCCSCSNLVAMCFSLFSLFSCRDMKSVSQPQLVSSACILSQRKIPLWRPFQFNKKSFLVMTSIICCNQSCFLSVSRHTKQCRDKIFLRNPFFVSATFLLSQQLSFGLDFFLVTT